MSESSKDLLLLFFSISKRDSNLPFVLLPLDSPFTFLKFKGICECFILLPPLHKQCIEISFLQSPQVIMAMRKICFRQILDLVGTHNRHQQLSSDLQHVKGLISEVGHGLPVKKYNTMEIAKLFLLAPIPGLELPPFSNDSTEFFLDRFLRAVFLSSVKSSSLFFTDDKPGCIVNRDEPTPKPPPLLLPLSLTFIPKPNAALILCATLQSSFDRVGGGSRGLRFSFEVGQDFVFRQQTHGGANVLPGFIGFRKIGMVEKAPGCPQRALDSWGCASAPVYVQITFAFEARGSVILLL
ncbi:sequence-specific DNA binding transcription factors [Striga asiatica]|uniref:Sequence-specific DNA binding transcription factors n=1 Tax=Striga asiatica TaxID=4170 RepID=A0A5A7PRB3_STRAF|nr:sequence-specific DNA binding transcription factors [Striga asiatica]